MTVSFSDYIKSYDTNCFRAHILESLEINKERKSVYSQLTNSRSDKIFHFLIGSEYVSLGPAAYYDLRARKFQNRGMSLFGHEFMSMNRVSEFDPENRVIPPAARKAFNWKQHKEILGLAIQKRDDDQLKIEAANALKELFQQPHYHCMTRHIIESIYRFAYFLPLREEEAKLLGILSPAGLIWDVIRLHLLGMQGSYQIDEWCGPIQHEGIPILCSELPDLLKDLPAI